VLSPVLSDDQLLKFLQDWKTAWEQADLESYASFYAQNAVQAGAGLKRMLSTKRRLWERAKPLEIVFDAINITRTKQGIKISMLQSYTDSKGYSDRGIKTLLLESPGGIPRIVREDWKPEKK
jgi:murein L,D-transpeptidase YafK